MKLILESPEQIPTDTASENACPKVVLIESCSSREETSKRAPIARSRNFKSTRSLGKRRMQNAAGRLTGRKAAMEGEGKTISARLKNPELWQLFHQEETEMIITKAGRRMFPVPGFCLSGLNPGQYYGCAIEVIAVDSYRYRHKSSKGWLCSGKGMPVNQSHSKYLHPNSASLGQYWIREGAVFDKLKLSNHILPTGGNIVLNSMQKYRLRLIVTKLGMDHCDRWLFDFPETQFITVTSYQNPRMTQLKIDNNPFAKAFREGKRASRRDSGESKAKKRRTRFPSPPPIIRYQTPFISFLSNQDQPSSQQALPPIPPPPPLSHDWPEEPLLARGIPVHNAADFPFSWERDESMAPAQGISSTNSSFKVDVSGTFQWRENFPFPFQEFSAPEEVTFQPQPQFPTPCYSVPPPTSAFGLCEDAHAQLPHCLSRDPFWREI